MRERRILDVEEGQSLAEDLRLVVLLDAEPLPRMQAAETFLERVRNVVACRHGASSRSVELAMPTRSDAK